MQRSSSGKEEHGAGGVRQQGTAEDAEKPRRGKREAEHARREWGGSGLWGDWESSWEAKQDAFLKC